MNETIINENLEQIDPIDAKVEKIYKYFDEEIKDEGIRQFILGEKGFSVKTIFSVNSYIKYIKNVLNLTFFFAYACYKNDMENNERAKKVKRSNSKRVIKSLSDVFVKTPVTQELIQFVLADIQFDLVLGSSSELRKIFGNMINMGDGFSFNEYFKLVSRYNNTPGKYQYNDELLCDMFSTLLEKLTFLKEYCLVQGEAVDVFKFVNNNTKAEMELDHIIYRNDARYTGGYYTLFKMHCVDKGEDIESSSITLTYLSSDGDVTLSFKHSAVEEAEHLQGQGLDEIYNDITGYDWAKKNEKQKKNDVIDRIHTINYKYIKNLALAIADTISNNSVARKKLYCKYSGKYPYVFRVQDDKFAKDEITAQNNQPYDNPLLDWDTIVVMLLIEESPTVFLEYLFRDAKDLLYRVAKNLYERAYNVETLELFDFDGDESDEIDDAVNRIIKELLIEGESAGFGQITSAKVYEKLFPRAAAMLVISKLSEMQAMDYKKKLVYTGNLRGNISLLQSSKETNTDNEKIRYSCIILGETFKHLMCFYSGLFAYGEAKAEYDDKACGVCLSDETIKEEHDKLKVAFIKAARVEANRLSKSYSVNPEATIVLMEQLIDFCKKCEFGAGTLSYESKCLYTAIGKYEIIDIGVLRQFLKRLSKGREKYDYDADVWIDTALDVLEYLKTGSTSDTPMDSDLFNAVYPFTAVFNRRKENPDGYKTVTFSLNIDVDDDNNTDHSQDVNVLSEFNYESDVYYCLPNILRSNYKWWIDPVLISFKDFNDIFQNDGKDI